MEQNEKLFNFSSPKKKFPVGNEDKQKSVEQNRDEKLFMTFAGCCAVHSRY